MVPNDTTMIAFNRKYRTKEEEQREEDKDETLKTRGTSIEPISINRKSLSWIMLHSLVVCIDKLLQNHSSRS
jgi:hypothetical protein